MQRAAFAGGDDEGGSAGALRLRNLDLLGDTEGLGDARHRGLGLRQHAGAEVAAGDSDVQPFSAAREQRRDRLRRAVDADGIIGVVALHGVVGEREIARAARQRSQVIEARHEREGVRAREPSVGRLEAEDAAQRGRHADRAVGVGAERDRHHAAGDRAAGAARRAAGHVGDVVRIARGAIVHVLAGEVVGIFPHVEGADEDGAGRFKARDQGGVARRGGARAIDLRARERRQSRDVEQVLDRERYACERPHRPAVGARGIDRVCPGERALADHCGEGVKYRIARADACERVSHNGRSADTALGHGSGDLAGRRPGCIHGG
jgi:hypothetical protein